MAKTQQEYDEPQAASIQQAAGCQQSVDTSRSPRGLTSLPVELLKHVPGYLDVRSLTRVCLVSKQTRTACVDPFILRDIVLNGNSGNYTYDYCWLYNLPTLSSAEAVWDFLLADLEAAQIAKGATPLGP